MTTETITLSNMRVDQLERRLREAKEGLGYVHAGARIVIAVAAPGYDQPLRLSDVGGFEIRAAIELDACRHVAEIEAEIAHRQETRK